MTDPRKLLSAERMRQARLDWGMTQIDLAKATGFHPDTIQSWEVGRATPRPHFLKVLAEQLDRPIWWLRGSPEPHKKEARW